MGAVQDTAVKILDECREKIQKNIAVHYRNSHGERWINASGRSSDAFKIESNEMYVRLIYKGDDVAPLDTIQYGHNGQGENEPTVPAIIRWAREKFGWNITPVHAQRIVDKIKRIGTERWREPEEWIITPVLDDAVMRLQDELPAKAVDAIRAEIFI